MHAKQRRYLRGLAHGLRAVVQVGQAGVSPALLAELDRALAHHELVKVRLHSPEDKRASARSLADLVGAELCGIIGHTVILYRPDLEVPLESRKIRLP